MIRADRCVVIGPDPGIIVGAHHDTPEQTIESVWVNDRPGGDWCPRGSLRFGDLDPVTVCELLADLADLTAPTG